MSSPPPGSRTRFSARPASRRRSVLPTRAGVAIPDGVPETDAIFLLLRRLRVPLVVLITIFAVSVFGLTLIPGVDADGNPTHLTVFDAFYFMSYTATTIGFGEIAPFTTAQRLWVTASIYSSVIGWAYGIGTLLGLLQEKAFKDAIAAGQFRRRVRSFTEPFVIISGFGHAGHEVSRGLDFLDRPFVVVDGDPERIEVLRSDDLSVNPAGMAGDLRNPVLLGMAGLGRPACEAVLALTDDDDINLATVITTRLMRPDVQIFARCSTPEIEERMHDFGATAVINPFDRFGGYLLVALSRPAVHQLTTWLMAPNGAPLPEHREGLAAGRWVVCADGAFGKEIARDLGRAGLDVTRVDPSDGDPDVTGVAGFVAGAERDTTNLALAVHAQITNPDLYLVLLQKEHTSTPLVHAIDVDSVFVPADLVARESIARLTTPMFWAFIDHALTESEEWGVRAVERMTTRVGTRSPRIVRVDLVPETAPAVNRWLGSRGGSLTLGELLKDPVDRSVALPLAALSLHRGGRVTHFPDDDVALLPGDSLLLAGQDTGYDALDASLYYDDAVEYLATGLRPPSTWAGRLLLRALNRRSVDVDTAPDPEVDETQTPVGDPERPT